MKRYCGRDFSAPDFALIRAWIAADAQRSRAELSRLTCQAWHGYQPNGGLKDMSCRVALLSMERDGLIQRPPPRCQRPQARIRTSAETDPPVRPCLAGSAATLGRTRRGLAPLE